MAIDKSYFFDSIDDLVAHLKSLTPNMGPIRLQKTLYFLFAFYGATYGKLSNKNKEGISEIDDSDQYPNRLFDGEFEAWQYGPVVREVYFSNRDDEKSAITDPVETKYRSNKEQDVIKFIDNLVNDLNDMSDFALVDRTHQDKVWNDAFNPSEPHASRPINNDELIEEYAQKISEASKI